MAEFRKVHQFNVFTVNTPCQLGIAEYMQRRLAPPRPGALLSGETRLLPRAAGGFALRTAALSRNLLPAGALRRDFRPSRPRVRLLADARGVGAAWRSSATTAADDRSSVLQEATLAAAGDGS
jgi:hypothetical protein